MMNHKIKFFCLIGITIVFFGLPFKKVLAQTSALKLSPFLIQQDLKRDSGFDGSVKITNASEKNKYLVLSLRNFLPSGTDGATQILAENQDSPQAIVNWITISKQPEYKLKPGQTTEVNFHIQAPPDSTAGSHYGALLFTLSDQIPEAGQSLIVQQAATLLIVDVDRGFENAKISSFQLDKIGYEDSKLQFETIIENAGLTSIAPKGKIEIYNWANNLVATAYVNPDANLILPNTKRVFVSAAKGNFSGPYSAKLTVWYGSKKLEIHKSVFVWIWPPLDAIIKLVIYLSIFGVLLRFLIKRYNAWIIKKYG